MNRLIYYYLVFFFYKIKVSNLIPKPFPVLGLGTKKNDVHLPANVMSAQMVVKDFKQSSSARVFLQDQIHRMIIDYDEAVMSQMSS